MTSSFQEWLSVATESEVIEKLKVTREWLKGVVIRGSVALAVSIVVSLFINQTEWRMLNLVFPFVLIVLAVIHAVDPFKFLISFGGGAAYYQGLSGGQLAEMHKAAPSDSKVGSFISAGIKGVNVWWEVLVLMWLAAFLWFMMMATIPVSLRFAPGAILVLMAALLATFKWPSATHWFKLICSAGIGLFGLIYIGGALFSETKIGQRVGETTESAYTELAGKTYQFQHVVVTERNVDLSNFRDADNDGIVDQDERKPVKVPAGCYQLTISGPQAIFSAAPNVSQDIGGALRIGFQGDMGYKNGDKISVPEGAQLLAGMVNPVAGSHLVDPNTGAATWRTVDVSFAEATGCPAE